jgi:hypothetical protein
MRSLTSWKRRAAASLAFDDEVNPVKLTIPDVRVEARA